MSSDPATPGNTMQRDPARVRESSAMKRALMGLAGGGIEWYDFLLYGTASALVFPALFFPATLPPFVALIASFSTFAVGFVARPFGAVLFGHLGDRVGRKTTLAAALVLMGTATTLIAFLPTYHSVGVFAPLALVLLRLLQGLAVGGQWGGATLLATENAPPSKRGLYGSITQLGVPAGVLLANIAFLTASGATTPEAFMAYGWRIPFALSIVLVGLGLFMHFRLEETVAFRLQSGPKAQSPILEALRQYPARILLAAAASVPSNVSFYIGITYAVAYGTSATGLQLPRSTMLGAVLVSCLISAPVTLLAGALSDRYGRRRIIMAGILFQGAWVFGFFQLIETRSFLWISAALTVSGVFNCLMYGPLAAMFAELFDTRVRYSAMSLAYQISAIVGGGFAPIIATVLFARYHTNMWMAAYMAAVCALSLACVSKLTETRGIELAKPAPPPGAVLRT